MKKTSTSVSRQEATESTFFLLQNTDIAKEDAKAKLHADAEKFKEDMKIKWAALRLRSEIMKLPKSKTPTPTTVQNLNEYASNIPAQLELFFKTLLCETHQVVKQAKNTGPKSNINVIRCKFLMLVMVLLNLGNTQL